MKDASATGLVEDLFRRESAHLVAALARVLGPARVALAEDIVQDALMSALQAWSVSEPDDPKAWILRAAKNRAIDILRRDRRLTGLDEAAEHEPGLEKQVELALSPDVDATNQLAMMFAICDDDLAPETHVTLILRLLCGFSAAEIARAFLVDVQTIDRRLYRGRARLRASGAWEAPRASADFRARQSSVERALYLLFNEGYHGSDPESPLCPALCGDALRLVELLIDTSVVHGAEAVTAHALAALFCFNAARLSTRLDSAGVFVPLREQDRSRWDRSLFERGLRHLAASASGDALTRFHLEAGIAFEHTSAPSVEATNFARIVDYFDALLAVAPDPIVALNRGIALAELHGTAAGRAALEALEMEPRLANYSFYWAARADIERREGNDGAAISLYERAIALARSAAERRSYERRVRALAS